MQFVFTHLFGYNILSFRKLTYDEFKVVVKELQLPMLFISTDIQSETQQDVIGVFPSAEGDKISHIVKHIQSAKLLTHVVVMDVGFKKVMRIFYSCLMCGQEEEYNRKVCAKETETPHNCLVSIFRFYHFQIKYRIINTKKEEEKIIQNLRSQGR